MDLRSQVLKFLQKEPRRHFTTAEIASGVYKVKANEKLLTEHHSRIWEVTDALNALIEKGEVEGIIIELLSREAGLLHQGTFVNYPRYVIVYQAKKT
jgi:hypothetical protein